MASTTSTTATAPGPYAVPTIRVDARWWLLAAVPPVIGLILVLAGVHIPGLLWLALVGIPLVLVRVAPLFARVFHDTMAQIREPLPAVDDTATMTSESDLSPARNG